MTIPSITNTQTAGVQNSIGQTLESSSDIANKLSSGNKIISPSEDPAGLAIGTKLEVDLAVFKEALNSANQALVVLNIAYGGAKGITGILKRLSQLSIMALTGSAGDADRKLIDLEAQQLIKEIDRTAESTKFNGRSLINGSTAESKINTVDDILPLPLQIDSTKVDLKFLTSGIEVLEHGTTTKIADITYNSDTNKFEVAPASGYAFGDTVNDAIFTTSDKAGSDYTKALFTFDGTNTAATAVQDGSGIATKSTANILELTNAKVKDNTSTIIYNYAPPSAFEFKFSLHDNAITDAKGNKLIIYDKAGTAFYLNGNGDNTYILDDKGTPLYKVEDTGKIIKSLDGTKTYFKIDDPQKIVKIDNFSIMKDGSPATAELDLTDTNGEVKYAGGGQVFIFDKDKQKTSSMVFQIGTETTDKIYISLDGATAKDLGVDKLSLTSYEKAEEARIKGDEALEYMYNYNANIGAYQSRFKIVAESVSTSIENVDAARAQFLDADFTELTKQFSQDQAKLSASITAQGKLIGTPQKLLGLLQYM